MIFKNLVIQTNYRGGRDFDLTFDHDSQIDKLGVRRLMNVILLFKFSYNFCCIIIIIIIMQYSSPIIIFKIKQHFFLFILYFCMPPFPALFHLSDGTQIDPHHTHQQDPSHSPSSQLYYSHEDASKCKSKMKQKNTSFMSSFC